MFTVWPRIGDAVMGLLPERVGAPVNAVLDEKAHAAAGQGYLEWVSYRGAAELHTQLVEPEMVTDRRMLDAMTLCATRIATRTSMSQSGAEQLLYRAIVLRDRLPQVLECLKNGQVSPRHIRTIASRTELVDGRECAPDVDAAIAERPELLDRAWRGRHGRARHSMSAENAPRALAGVRAGEPGMPRRRADESSTSQ